MKKKDIAFVLFIFIAIFSVIIVKEISNLDEIWNYNTARAITQGLIPYKDISMITTPFLPMITSIFLKFIANEVIISRILAAVLWTGIIFTIYKILYKLIKEENTSLMFTFLIGILSRNIYCIDYNVFVLFLSLIILYNELKNIDNKDDRKNDFICGIIAGLAICTKQSIGVILAFITVIYKLLFAETKEQFKQNIKASFIRMIGILIPTTVLVLYLIFTGAISEFINYAVLGIKTFSNNIPYTDLFYNENIEIKVLAAVIPVSIVITLIILIVTVIKKFKNTNMDNLLTILLYSFAMIIVLYPICDEIHFLLGMTISIIGLIYLTYLLAIKIYKKINIKHKYKIYKILSLIIWLLLFSVIATKTIVNINKYIKQNKNENINHYKSIEISDVLTNRINNIDKYIKDEEQKGNTVYILDAEAAVYMLPLDKYNKDYDMFLKGNIGKDGENGQIEKIKVKNENIIYLIRKESIKNNWQTPLDVIDYIRNNLEKIGEIEIYEIYR